MSEIANHDDFVDRALDAAARALGEQGGEAMTGHPSSEELVCYQEKRLTTAAEQRVREHLVHCVECAQDVLALQEIDLEQVDDESCPNPSQTAQAWQTFQQRLDQEPSEPGFAGADVAKSEPSDASQGFVTRPGSNVLAMAASILLAFGFGYWFSAVGRGPTRSDLATSRPLLVDLVPDGTMLIRDAAGETAVAVAEGVGSLIFRLNLGDQTGHGGYRAEILDSAGAIRWQQADLRPQPTGEFLLLVARMELTAGSYQVKLFGIGKGASEILATYSFQLRDDPDG